MGLTSWVVGKAAEDLLKNRLGVSDSRKRRRVVREVKKMVKWKHEPVALGGFAGVGAALFAAFGLELSPADLALTVSTVITVITFIQRKLVSPVGKKDQP